MQGESTEEFRNFDNSFAKLSIFEVTSDIAIKNYWGTEIQKLLEKFDVKKNNNAKKLLEVFSKNILESNELYELTLVYIVSIFEFYLLDVLRYIFRKKIVSLKTRDRKIDYETLIDFKTIDELYDYMIEREIEKVSFKKIEDIGEYFSSKFKINFFKDKGYEEKIKEIFCRRNILVHNMGKVNKKYLEITKTKEMELNQKIKVDRDYLVEVRNIIYVNARFIDYQILKKF